MVHTNELQQFTFANGRTIQTRQVSVLLTMELHQKFSPPRPPVVEVELANGEKSHEENPSDPDYLTEYRQYQIEQEDRIRRLLIKRGAIIEWTDENRKEITDLREFWKAEYGYDLPGDDTMVYISHICCGPQEDVEKLIQKILRQSQPTQEAVEAAQESFPGPVQGS